MELQDEILEFFDFPLMRVGGSTLTLGTALMVFGIIVATFWLAGLVRRVVARAFRNRLTTDEQAISIYSRLVSAVVLILGLGLALRTAGLELTALFAAGGVFAVAVGFAAQPLIANFVSGAVLRFEGAIKHGDVLDVNGRMVKIQKMMMRAMVARDLDEQDVVIPNSELAQTTVTNYTLRDRQYRLRTTVGVVYSSDMRHVRKTLEDSATAIDWRSPYPSPVVLLRRFGDSSVDYEVSVWIDDPWVAQRRRSDLNETLWWALKEAGITIAFPQLDVHFDGDALDALGRGRDRMSDR